MKTRPRWSFVLFLLFAGCSATLPLQTPAPSTLPNTDRLMKTAGFWISRILQPDAVILSVQQIEEINAAVQKDKLASDILLLPQKLTSRDILAEIKNEFDRFSHKRFYLNDGRFADKSVIGRIGANMNISSKDQIAAPRFGFIVHYADQRLLPTDTALLEKKGDVDFDELQNSALDAGTPVAILHETVDRQWLYCSDGTSSGWIKKEFVAFVDADRIAQWRAEPFVVIVSPKADIFLDPELRNIYEYSQMGRRFVLSGEAGPGITRISLPLRQEDGQAAFTDAFLKTEDIHTGYLAYTSRTIIEQAFKLLNAPYGWGGMYGEQDCSRFLQEVFSTVGIQLPRNSGSQIKVGKNIARFENKSWGSEKIRVLQSEAVPGATLLGMKGHIMLFLGMVKDQPYAIHATWAYRERQSGQEVARVISKVTVSDLSLGKDSSKGSLLERLKNITLIGR